jgi:hypothetical protein
LDFLSLQAGRSLAEQPSKATTYLVGSLGQESPVILQFM